MTTTLATLLSLTSSTSRHRGLVGPTAGAVAFNSGLSYVQTLRELRELREAGKVTAEYDRSMACDRYLPTAETAAIEGQP
jgi:hypothetical protein